MAIRVILLEPEKEGNIGAVARSMRNFALDDLWIVNPQVSIGGEARAYAMRGLEVLTSAKIVGTMKEALAGVAVVVGTSAVTARGRSNLSRVSMTAHELADKVRKSSRIVGIVFGRESSGLNNMEVEECDFMVTIPANPDYNVLNIATAASILFYEIFQNKTAQETDLAHEASKKRLLFQFDRLVERSQIPVHRSRLARRAFRNVISRSFISTQ